MSTSTASADTIAISEFISTISKKHRLDEDDLQQQFKEHVAKRPKCEQNNNVFAQLYDITKERIQQYNNRAVNYLDCTCYRAESLCIRAAIAGDIDLFTSVYKAFFTDEEYHPIREYVKHFADVFNEGIVKELVPIIGDVQVQYGGPQSLISSPFDSEMYWLQKKKIISKKGVKKMKNEKVTELLKSIRIVHYMCKEFFTYFEKGVDDEASPGKFFYAKGLRKSSKQLLENLYNRHFGEADFEEKLINRFILHMIFSVNELVETKEPIEDEPYVLQMGEDVITLLFIKLLKTPGNPLKKVEGLEDSDYLDYETDVEESGVVKFDDEESESDDEESD
jgi:hypothetical protein